MITIIGGGPIGCYAGYLLAKVGLDVNIYEEDKVIGKPFQCTGIVTNSFKEVIGVKKEFLVNTLDKVKVFAPNNSFVELDLKKKEFVIDRTKFDQYLANKAIDAGVNLHLNHKFIGKKSNDLIIKDLKNNKIKIKKIKKIIGADGPLSQVAKIFSMYGERKFYVGNQVRVKGNFEENCYETYFGRNFPNFFGWVVPESDKIARIGLATRKNSLYFFQKFLRMKGVIEKDIIEKQGGVMPIYSPNVKVQKDNVFLVGDAATHVKATTGGGLVHGLMAAKCLAKSITDNKSYERLCFNVNKDLRMHLMIRNVLNRFNDKDYDYLVKLVSGSGVKNVLGSYDRDFPLRLLVRLLVNEPRFLFFSTKLL